jgi:hypothetical protein
MSPIDMPSTQAQLLASHTNLNTSFNILHRQIPAVIIVLYFSHIRMTFAHTKWTFQQGCEYVFQDTRQTGEYFSIFTRQVRKQLAKNIKKDQ